MSPALQVGVPAVNLAGALVVKDVQHLAEDSHITANREEHPVFQVNLRGFPKREL